MRTFGSDAANPDATLADAEPLPFPKGVAKAPVDHLPQGAQAVLAPIVTASPHIRALVRAEPQLVERLLTEPFHRTYDELLGAPLAEDDRQTLAVSLRTRKRRASLVASLADLCGAWSSAETGRRLADLADGTLQAAVAHAIRRSVDAGQIGSGASGIAVIAMGKHGARELNYSSDIDLIAVFDPQAPALSGLDDPVKATTRIMREVVWAMQDTAAGGYVFRTDFRLRPDPGSMPLVVPLPVALHYYEARGQNWERAAFIKARAVAGDAALGQEFLSLLRPFVWRRYLDFAAISDIHSIKRQIQSHRDLGTMQVHGHDVKLGRGGIREIEFFVQTQQLIAGGRDDALRTPRTLDALAALAEAGWITPDVSTDLTQAYGSLRDVEHRLQMVADAQTHAVPADPEGLARVAALCAHPVAAFQKSLLATLRTVERHYLALFEKEPALGASEGALVFTGAELEPETEATLTRMGFADPQRIGKAVRHWHAAGIAATQTPTAREDLTVFLPALLETISATERPQAVFDGFASFLERLPAGVQLFAMLRARPQLLSLLVRILTVAPRLARLVAQHPHVFDRVLEGGAGELDDEAELVLELRSSLDRADGWEDVLDRARAFAQEHRFVAGARMLAGTLPPAQAGTVFSRLAGVVLAEMTARVHDAFRERHGDVEGGSFCVVAMGNLGSRTLTATSDLDLVLLYEVDDLDRASNGPRPLPATQYYARLTQRLVAAMTAHTARGILYELDFRLRPSGRSGPLATRLSAFVAYQRENAETWEHQALTRARPVAGHARMQREVEAAIGELVGRLAGSKGLGKEVLAMRRLLDREQPPAGAFDLKRRQGGLMDLEFLAQYAVLRGIAPKGCAIADALRALDGDPLPNAHVTLAEAHRTFVGVQQLVRLCLDDVADDVPWPDALGALVAKEVQTPDLATARAVLDGLAADVRTRFTERLTGEMP